MYRPFPVRSTLAGSLALGMLAGSTTAQDYRIHHLLGDSPGDEFGFTTVGIGDVDGDGRGDIAVGGPMHFVAPAGPGFVRALSGATGAVLWTVLGDAPDDRLGWTLAAIGDISGDGVPDVLAGAYKNDAHGTDAGMIRIFSGVDGAVLRTTLGGDALDFYGYSVGAVTDVDQDGVPDYAVGAWQDETNGNCSGAAYLYSGATGVRIRTFLGESAELRYGHSIRGAGDVDGDGRGELLVGVPGAQRVEIRSGADGSILRALTSASTTDSFGFGVQGAGDIDGDLVPDALVNALKHDSARGYVELYSGATGALLHHFEGDAQGDYFGVGMCGLRDLDGDGHGELAISGFKNDTNGHESGILRVYTGKSGAVLHTIVGDSGLDWFGYAVTNGGDVDMDGFDDLLVGANQDQVNGFHSGSVSVYSGRAFGTATTGCYGDGIVTACPCGNAGVPGIARGCANSTGIGAALAGSGTASVSQDSFALNVSGLPTTTPVLLFQGQNLGGGSAFGDGRLCVSGSVRRLSTRTSTNGGVTWPWFASTPLSVLGSIPSAGATVHYQAWYRNPLGPCGTGFNLSNSATRTWSP